MTEKYLHYLWRQKRLPINDFLTTDGRPVSILDFGEFNEILKGPDFRMGCVQMDDVKWVGSIEMHVKSSDWYKHGHHLDRNYNNVILHVVYEYDKEVVQNNAVIPTIELKSSVDVSHFNKYRRKLLRQERYPCATLLSSLDEFHFNFMKHRALIDKLNVKIEELHSLGVVSESAAFYALMAMAFGTGINKPMFKSFVEQVPFNQLMKLNPTDRFNLIIALSGFLNDSKNHNWHFKGTRPNNSPKIRVYQFARLIQEYDFDTAFISNDVMFIRDFFRSKMKTIYSDTVTLSSLSESFINQLMVNAVVPLLWYVGEQKGDQQLKDMSVSLLELLPAENNSIIRGWNKINVVSQSAFDSQALLALDRYYCCRKKCLSCDVGTKLLNR